LARSLTIAVATGCQEKRKPDRQQDGCDLLVAL
jgi:hypothetical protein